MSSKLDSGAPAVSPVGAGAPRCMMAAVVANKNYYYGIIRNQNVVMSNVGTLASSPEGGWLSAHQGLGIVAK